MRVVQEALFVLDDERDDPGASDVSAESSLAAESLEDRRCDGCGRGCSLSAPSCSLGHAIAEEVFGYRPTEA